MGKLRILVGDDHTLVRQGFRKILEERPGVGRHRRGQRRPRIGAAGDVGPARHRHSGHRYAAFEWHRGDPPDRTPAASDSCPHPEHARGRSVHHPGTESRRPGYMLKDSADTDLIRGVGHRGGRGIVLQSCSCEGHARRLRSAFGRKRDRRSVRLVVRAGTGSLPVNRGRTQQQSHRRSALGQPATIETHRAHVCRSSISTTPLNSCFTRSGVV